MSKETQTMVPENAEPVYQLWSDEGFGGWTDTDKATYCWWLDSKNPPRMRKLYTAPVAAQPDLTQQTLEDVMAGIPARDAEIAALRKEIDSLRAQPPVSGADLVRIHDDTQPIYLDGVQCQYQVVRGDLYPNDETLAYVFDKDIAERIVVALNANTAQLDHLPDATKIVEQAGALSGQNRPETRKDTVSGSGAQPSGNYGKLPPLPQGISQHGLIGHDSNVYTDAHMVDYALAALAQMVEPKLDKPAKVGGGRFGVGIKWSTVITAAQRLYEYEVTPEKEAERIAGADQKMQALWHHIAAQAQQDADKVDVALAEMVHAMFRSGNSVPVTRIMIDRKQYESAIDAARKEQA